MTTGTVSRQGHFALCSRTTKASPVNYPWNAKEMAQVTGMCEVLSVVRAHMAPCTPLGVAPLLKKFQDCSKGLVHLFGKWGAQVPFLTPRGLWAPA